MTYTKLALASRLSEPVEIPEELAPFNGGSTTFAPEKRVTVVRRGLARWLQENRRDLF